MAGPIKGIPLQLDGEVWEQLPDAHGYEVSTLGRVRSYWKNRWGIRRKPHILTGGVCNKGYMCVKIKYPDKTRTVTIYKLVLLTFVGPAPKGMECCHGNGINTDDRLCNIRWDTPSNNQKDKLKHGTHRQGEKINFAKLTEDQVREIKSNPRGTGVTLKQYAKKYNVNWMTIWDIENGRTWKHVKVGDTCL